MADSFQSSIKATPYTIAKVAEHLNARVIGDENQTISAINSLTDAQTGEISFLSDKRLLQQLKTTQASAVLVNEAAAEHCPVTAIIVDNPYAAYAHTATYSIHSACIFPASIQPPLSMIKPRLILPPGLAPVRLSKPML